MPLDTLGLTSDFDLDLNADGSANVLGETDAIAQDIRVILHTPLGSHPIHRGLGVDSAEIISPSIDLVEPDSRLLEEVVQLYTGGAVERAILDNTTGVASIDTVVVERTPSKNTVHVSAAVLAEQGGTILVEEEVA